MQCRLSVIHILDEYIYEVCTSKRRFKLECNYKNKVEIKWCIKEKQLLKGHVFQYLLNLCEYKNITANPMPKIFDLEIFQLQSWWYLSQDHDSSLKSAKMAVIYIWTILLKLIYKKKKCVDGKNRRHLYSSPCLFGCQKYFLKERMGNKELENPPFYSLHPSGSPLDVRIHASQPVHSLTLYSSDRFPLSMSFEKGIGTSSIAGAPSLAIHVISHSSCKNSNCAPTE